MKKNINNNNIKGIIDVLSAQDCFIATTKMPHVLRQAIRINTKTLNERLAVYDDGIRDILETYKKNGKATANDDGAYKISEDALPDINRELIELAAVDNELDIVTIPKEIVNTFLEGNELKMAEEDVLLFFCEE